MFTEWPGAAADGRARCASRVGGGRARLPFKHHHPRRHPHPPRGPGAQTHDCHAIGRWVSWYVRWVSWLVFGGCLDVFGGCLGMFGGYLGMLGGCLDVFGGCLGMFGGCLGMFSKYLCTSNPRPVNRVSRVCRACCHYGL